MAVGPKFAVFIDYDNIAIGVRETLNRTFDYRVVSRWLEDRGEILAQTAYGNWSAHGNSKTVSRSLTKQGVQMEHLPTGANAGKNGADIALSIDAVELVFTQQHIDAFCILSGDSDFLPLVRKLKKHNKKVYVIAEKSFASENLRRNCNEFVSYERLCEAGSSELGVESAESAVPVVRRALRAMERRGEVPYNNQLLATIRGLAPDFDVRRYGCESFRDLLITLVGLGHFRQRQGEFRFCIEDPGHRASGSAGELSGSEEGVRRNRFRRQPSGRPTARGPT